MPVLPLKLFPDAVLRQKACRVEVFDRHLLKTIQNLDDTMRAQKHGIGIAAPQVGLGRQIALVDVSARVSGAKRLILINPALLEGRGEKASREGCMSLPDYTGLLKRHEWVRLKWQDEQGKAHQGEFSGIEAVCIQHEVDHLAGMLFMDRVSSLKRDMIPRTLKDLKRKA